MPFKFPDLQPSAYPGAGGDAGCGPPWLALGQEETAAAAEAALATDYRHLDTAAA